MNLFARLFRRPPAPPAAPPEPAALLEARQQLELVETQLRLKQARRQLDQLDEDQIGDPLDQMRARVAAFRQARAKSEEANLSEAWPGPSFTGLHFGDLVDPMDRFRDADQFLTPPGFWEIRKGGDPGPIVLNWQDLANYRGMARALYDTNSYAKNAVETLEDFIVGSGCTYVAGSKEDAPDELVAAVQDVVDEFARENVLGEWEREFVRRDRRDGEVFARVFRLDGGCTALRFVEPEHIIEPTGNTDPHWKWGVRHKAGDIQTIEAYWYQPDPGQPGGEEIPSHEIEHSKANVDRGVKRGLSDFFCVQEPTDGARKLLRNLREGSAIQAAIAWIEQYDSTPQSSIQTANAGRDDFTRPSMQASGSQRTINYQRYDPGTILKVPRGKTYVPSPLAQNVPSHGMVLQAVLRSIGVRWRMPEYMISGDASNANYASTLVSGTPFVRSIEAGQAYYTTRFLRILWAAVEHAAACNRFPGYSVADIRRLIDIQCEAPSPIMADELAKAQAAQIDMQAGVLSKQTRRQQLGLDDEQERTNLAKDPITPATSPAGPGGGGPGPLPFFPPRLSTG